jgi:ribose/xylose/arabinose/galactoside ABC-type transport system permease subunit
MSTTQPLTASPSPQPAPPAGGAAPDAGRDTQRLRRRVGALGVPIILLVLVLIFQAKSDQFLTVDNIKTIFESAALPAIAACGLTVVLALGEFDLSVQAVAGFATTTVAVLMANQGFALFPAIGVVLLIGALIGLVNGALVAYGRLAALVVTIGMGSLLNGGEFAVSGSQAISSGISPGFVSFARSSVGPVPTLVVVAAVVAVLLWLLLDRTAMGREMRAVGTNADAARFAGVDVRRTIVVGFVIAGAMAALAGILYTGRQGNVYPLTGLTILLQSFAACFIGAAMFRLGEFNIPGTVVGALLASVVSNGLLLANVANYATYFFQGGILIVAILFARVVAGKTQEA